MEPQPTEAPASDPAHDVVESYDKLTQDELGNLGIVLGAYRSFRGDRRGHIAYVSMPITSGKRFYETLAAEGVTSLEELSAKRGKDALYELVIKPNVAEGIALADKLGDERRNLLFIAPSVFEAKKWRWSQHAYMSLWYRVIGELAGKHYLMDGWEYSTGGLQEVLFSMLMRWRVIRSFNVREGAAEFRFANFHPGLSREKLMEELRGMWEIRIYEADGAEVRLDQALAKAVGAIRDLQARGFDASNLIGPAWRLSQVPWRSPFFMAGFSPDSRDERTFSPLYEEMRDAIKEISMRPEAAP
ncbi:MAG TPA: hypothetical protein VL283_03555 [Candidatus Baltobacteraceae bacterium]|jgi:hypothetical protein|nr:hypothetical protein [Candidatus Baltobacteraceae bacterium]